MSPVTQVHEVAVNNEDNIDNGCPFFDAIGSDNKIAPIMIIAKKPIVIVLAGDRGRTGLFSFINFKISPPEKDGALHSVRNKFTILFLFNTVKQINKLSYNR